MNKRQKEILQHQLTAEEQELKRLKAVYNKAMQDIDDSLAQLLGRDDATLQHVIYQIDYQKALKKQVGGILDELNSNQFTSISEYLAECYENGFVSTMYDCHGQGVPILAPINQNQVITAIKHESKISEGLYKKLGVDTDNLKQRISNNISRGIASGHGYAQIAKNIAEDGKVGYNNAARIAQTDGARIHNAAAFDAQKEAKKKGADILKQWNSTLDGGTRPSHRRLDGQLRELDEPFEIDGHTAMHPLDFGIASEDINCRCSLLQRARWALEDDELETLKERAKYYGLDKTKDFDDFKAKYLKAAEKVSVQKPAKVFTPAKTVEEAETFAKQFVVEKTWSGNGNVSYKGLSLESANKMNEALAELFGQNELPSLSNIQPMNFRQNIWKGSETTPMAYRNLSTGELYFNPKIMKDEKTVAEYFAEGKKAFKICQDNIDKFTGKDRELIETYLKSGLSLVAEDCDDGMKAMIQHEVGHHIQNQLLMNNEEMMAIVKEGYEKYAVKISGYATKSYGEYIAESFSAYKNGKDDIIDPKLKAYFEGLVK